MRRSAIVRHGKAGDYIRGLKTKLTDRPAVGADKVQLDMISAV